MENVISQSGWGSNKTWWQAENGKGAGMALCRSLGSRHNYGLDLKVACVEIATIHLDLKNISTPFIMMKNAPVLQPEGLPSKC